MSETRDADELLTVAVQDLHAAETLIQTRLPAIAEHAEDAELTAALARLVERAGQQAQVLAATERASGGSENLWMSGMLDDAERDTGSVAAGPLLDAALIGAVRKMLTAKLVSYETAIALADRLGEAAAVALLQRCRNEEAASDDRLATLLARAAGETPALDQ